MSRETCPFEVPKPAVSVARYAERLAPILLDPDWRYSEQEVPPLPDKVLTQGLTPAQLAKYRADAGSALYTLHFANMLREPPQEKKLHAVSYVPRQSGQLSHEEVVEAAVSRYGRMLNWMAYLHRYRRDPALQNVLRYRIDAQEQEDIIAARKSLLEDERRGRHSVMKAIKMLDHSYHELGLAERSEAEVLRNSFPSLRFAASIPRAKANSGVPFSLTANEIDGETALVADKTAFVDYWQELPDSTKRDLLTDNAGRTHNACPAVAPLKSVSDRSALELIVFQAIDVFESQKIF